MGSRVCSRSNTHRFSVAQVPSLLSDFAQVFSFSSALGWEMREKGTKTPASRHPPLSTVLQDEPAQWQHNTRALEQIKRS